MSNPAVIMLANTRTKEGGSFRIEDNIGEAIHIHFNNIRLDFTIVEFLAFAKLVEQSVDSLVDIDKFSSGDYDFMFLSSLGETLLDLKLIENCDVSLGDLEVFADAPLGPRIRKLQHSKMYKALKGDERSYIEYNQENGVGEENMERLGAVFKSVKENGYPFRGQHIVLFNRQNCIRDGQHRAAVLLHLRNDAIVPVKRFVFKGGSNDIIRNRFKSFMVYGVKYPFLRFVRRFIQLTRRILGKVKRCLK